ncbi:Apolipoprotein D [Pseudolycoriella hygida]|uniref:Apolipoprotein D n=1 Tax=Pseudolycoriella hygida TaxID=35572 RepID=A0A9Q0N6G6_9DIPT|nr:Apolipoprotein D [Pseudolycoriella hygida]
MNKSIILLFSLLLVTCAENISDSGCPVRPIFKPFDLQKYLGRWYELARYDIYFEKGCDCGYADYTLNDDGSVHVKNCCKRLPNTTPSCTIGKAVISYPNASPIEGKISVAFRGLEPKESNYWILDTDYDNFVIVYFCQMDDTQKPRDAFWLLGRAKELTAEIQEKADDYIERYFNRTAIYTPKQKSDSCGAE